MYCPFSRPQHLTILTMRWHLLCLVASLHFLSGLCYSIEANVIHSDGSLIVPDVADSYQPPSNLRYTRPDLVRRQEAGRCGPDFGGQICSNDQCCSFFGYCGLGQDHCSQIASCQAAYGYCEGEPLPTPSTTSLPPTPTPTPTTRTTSSTSISLPPTISSTTSTTVPLPPTTSLTSTTTPIVVPTTSSTSILPPLPTGTLVSTNGMCGNSTVCTGSSFGQCCSPYWYCGNSDEYCGVGCNPLYGSCGGIVSSSSSSNVVIPPTTSSTIVVPPTTSATSTRSTTSSSSIPPVVTTTSTSTSLTRPTPTPTPTPTPGGFPTTRDGTCGNGFSCNGWADGPCCSRFGYCGGDYLYCRQLLGCQLAFGTCDPT